MDVSFFPSFLFCFFTLSRLPLSPPSFLGVQSLYNVALVSTVQQPKLAICIFMCTHTHTHTHIYIYVYIYIYISWASQVALQCWRHRRLGFYPVSGRSLGGGHGNHSSIIAWRIPGTEKPGGLPSLGSQRVRHD